MQANSWKCPDCGYSTPKTRINVPDNATKPCPNCGGKMKPKV